MVSLCFSVSVNVHELMGTTDLESQLSVSGSYLNVGLNVIRPSVNSLKDPFSDISQCSCNTNRNKIGQCNTNSLLITVAVHVICLHNYN